MITSYQLFVNIIVEFEANKTLLIILTSKLLDKDDLAMGQELFGDDHTAYGQILKYFERAYKHRVKNVAELEIFESLRAKLDACRKQRNAVAHSKLASKMLRNGKVKKYLMGRNNEEIMLSTLEHYRSSIDEANEILFNLITETEGLFKKNR